MCYSHSWIYCCFACQDNKLSTEQTNTQSSGDTDGAELGSESSKEKEDFDEEVLLNSFIDLDGMASLSLDGTDEEPLQVKEYVRYLRKKQLQDMSTEEKQEEER